MTAGDRESRKILPIPVRSNLDPSILHHTFDAGWGIQSHVEPRTPFRNASIIETWHNALEISSILSTCMEAEKWTGGAGASDFFPIDSASRGVSLFLVANISCASASRHWSQFISTATLRHSLAGRSGWGNAQTGAKFHLIVVAAPGPMAVAVPAFPTVPIRLYPNYDRQRFWKRESHD